MSESFVLSLIFAGIIVLIGFLGATFGVSRGFVVTASILAGAELALWWGANLGRRLSDLFDISDETGRFLAAVALLFATVLFLGIMASLALSLGTPTRLGSAFAALLGAANGALLIAMALRLYYLAYSGSFSSVPLDDSLVTRVLWQNFDWFLLGFVLVATVLLLYARFTRILLTIPDPVLRASIPRPIPPPVSRPESRSSRSPDSQAVVPPFPQNGATAAVDGVQVDDAVYAPTAAPEPVPVQGATAAERSPEGGPAARTEPPTARNTVRFCPNCGMTLDASDRFCPDCGLTL